MKKNTGLMIGGILATFLVVNLVYAQGYPERKAVSGMKCKESPGQRMEKYLNLTPQQEQKLQDNRRAQRERMSQLTNQLKEKQQILRQELKKPSVTKASLAPILAEIKSLQAQLIDARVEGILAVKEILTPEQFVKFQEMTPNKQKGMRERFHQWRENRGKRTK
jgi:Spy/CpxP family protein refolding chaperone